MLLSDRPIVCATEDQLGFQPFCATLAKGLREMAPAEGLVVALHAPWGSGKTSALNLLQRHLEVLDIAQRTNQAVEDVAASAAARPDGPTPEECKRAIEWADLRSKHEKHLQTVVVRFNPWFFSGQENLFKAFFGVFGTELSTTCDTQVAAGVAAVLKRAEAAGSVLGTVLGTMAAGPGGAATGGTIGGFFGKLVGDKFDEKESLDASLRQLRTALQQSGRRFLIIIDDIDRLLPEELRQMLTLIKSVGNLPNITYLLAFARAEVADLIKRAGVANADYMEKIVQVSFELPRVDRYSLRNMLFNRLDTIRKGKELEDTSRWGTAFFEHIDPYLKTPRDVTRLCNSLQVIWPSVEDEVDWTDLVMLEILRLHEPTVYDLVLDKLDRLTGEKSSLSDDKKWAEDLVPTAVNSADFRTAKEALMTLFPRLAEVWEPNTGSWRKDHHALRNRRLQCAEYARNYFSLAPAPDQFTTGQINGLFRAENSLEAFNALFDQAKTRKTRQGLTMVSRLLQQIREQITPKNPMPQALIRAVLAKGDEIVRIRDSERMLFEVNNALRLSWVMVEALRAVPESDRATMMVLTYWLNSLAR
jgi:predicted KAP-like P-loop ATPase